MSDLWWKILVRKAPLYDRVDRNRQLLEHLRSTGQDPEPTRLRQTNMGQEVPAVTPQSTVGAQIGYSLPRLNNPNAKGSPFTEDNRYQWEGKNKNFSHFYQSDDEKVRAGIKHLGDNRYMLDHYAVREGLEDGGHGRAGLIKLKEELEASHGGPVQLVGTDDVVGGARGFWEKMAEEGLIEEPFGEGLSKEAKSPKALDHKREYETEYESSPARKKYRRELEGERRKRGVAGKGGGDMSHTKTGKIVVEDPHTNRARSHPSVGSTLKMVVVKAPLYDTATGKQVAGVPTPAPPINDDPHFEYDFSNHSPVQPNERFLYQSPDQNVRAIVESRGEHATIPLFATHDKERGKGHGRQALRDIDTELRSIHPNVKNIEPTGVTVEGEQFWEKMNDEGLISYDGEIEPIPNIDRETGEPFERGEPMDIALRLLKNETDEERRERELQAARAEADARAAKAAWVADNEQQEFDEDPHGERGQFDAAFQEEMKGSPMDIALRLLKEQKQLFVQGQKTLDGRPAFAPTDFIAEEQRRQATLKRQQDREKREAQRRKNAEGLTPLPFQQNPEQQG